MKIITHKYLWVPFNLDTEGDELLDVVRDVIHFDDEQRSNALDVLESEYGVLVFNTQAGLAAHEIMHGKSKRQ